MMPASEGEETLVPPRINHPPGPPWNRLVSSTQTPVLGFASKEKSGVPRKSPTIFAMRSWKCGRGSTWLGPPPASCQVFSRRNVPEFGSRERVVPPAEITFGEALGQPAPGLSPEEAMYTTPGVVKFPSYFVSFRNSPEPQLMENSPPPKRFWHWGPWHETTRYPATPPISTRRSDPERAAFRKHRPLEKQQAANRIVRRKPPDRPPRLECQTRLRSRWRQRRRWDCPSFRWDCSHASNAVPDDRCRRWTPASQRNSRGTEAIRWVAACP